MSFDLVISDLLSRQQMELRRLEEQYRGITRVNRAQDGSILIEDDDI